MAEYSNDNKGAIWKNDKKETENHPDFTGSAIINGVDMWVSAWKRKPDAKEKSPALSFTFKAKDEVKKQNNPKEIASSLTGLSNDFEEDAPF